MPSVALTQTAQHRAMLVAPGRIALWRSAGGSGSSGGSFAGPYPSAISGLTGWWDAGSFAGLVDANGVVLPGWNNPAGGVADKSTVGTTLGAYHYAGNGVPPQATPRLNGQLGGIGLNTVLPPALPASGCLLPTMDGDTGLSLPLAQLGSGSGWTVYLVWSRPNYLQGASVLPSSIALLTLGTTVILGADSGQVASPRLILFPGSSQTVLTNALERRHTHSIIIRNTPGAGVDVWLDGGQVAHAVANPLAPTLSGPLLFLHSGIPYGAAQCWFHEAATWAHALSSGDITTLLSCATRWVRGARKGVQLVVMGQSNAINAYGIGTWHVLAQGIAWHIGALAYNVIAASAATNGSAYTMNGGHGVSTVPFSGVATAAAPLVFPSTFLADPLDGSDPSGWSLGADGLAVQAYLAGQSADDLADVSLLVWPWTESDSARPYGDKTYYLDAVVKLLSLTRGMLGRSAASLPLMVWNAIPIGVGTNGGIQMVREATAAIAANSAQNVFIGWPQTCDSNPNNGSWNPATGVFTNPGSADFDHRDPIDLLRFGKIGAPVAARAILAASGGDTETTIPSGIPAVGGPIISHVYQAVAKTTTLILTITHDAGNDLIVPLLATTGQGFAVMDGGSVAAPGPIIAATACMRIDSTHLQLTLATAPLNAQAGLLLFYPYGYGNIFRGDAVTDNFASVAKPAGWDIGSDLGSAWTLNFPLAATTVPLAVSDTP